jgi:membrane-associated phospholipid phosphatase
VDKHPTIRAALYRLNDHVLGRMLTAGTLIYFCSICYLTLNSTLSPRHDLLVSFDQAVPFMPWTIAVYHSYYLLLLMAIVLVGDGRRFLHMMVAVAVVNFTCYLGFMGMTAHYPRPDPSVVDHPMLRLIFEWTFTLDGPGNTFPSIHVALTTFVVLFMDRQWRQHPWRRALWAAWGVGICISTMTVKQHFVADVLGGVAVAVAIYLLFARFFARDLNPDEEEASAQIPTVSR